MAVTVIVEVLLPLDAVMVVGAATTVDWVALTALPAVMSNALLVTVSAPLRAVRV